MIISLIIFIFVFIAAIRTMAYAVFTFREKNVSGGIALVAMCVLCVSASLICFT
ncbi:MAG: hypothetical protein ACLRQ0_01710 [Monoglobales bacterium]